EDADEDLPGQVGGGREEDGEDREHHDICQKRPGEETVVPGYRQDIREAHLQARQKHQGGQKQQDRDQRKRDVHHHTPRRTFLRVSSFRQCAGALPSMPQILSISFSFKRSLIERSLGARAGSAGSSSVSWLKNRVELCSK